MAGRATVEVTASSASPTAVASPPSSPTIATKAAAPTRPAPKVAAKKSPSKTGTDKLNEVLGKPYVLYPLCAAILLGAFWFSFLRNMIHPQLRDG